jgi:hypothetical protein
MEKATLAEMAESRNELLMEIARETGLDSMGGDEDEEEEEDDTDDGGDTAAPPAIAPPPPAPPTIVLEEIDEEGPVEVIPGQAAPMPHKVILADAKPEVPLLRLYHALLRDNEENPLRLDDDFDDLDNDSNEGRSDVDEWFPEDGSNDRD